MVSWNMRVSHDPSHYRPGGEGSQQKTSDSSTRRFPTGPYPHPHTFTLLQSQRINHLSQRGVPLVRRPDEDRGGGITEDVHDHWG